MSTCDGCNSASVKETSDRGYRLVQDRETGPKPMIGFWQCLFGNTYVHRVSTPDLAAALGTTNPEPVSAQMVVVARNAAPTNTMCVNTTKKQKYVQYMPSNMCHHVHPFNLQLIPVQTNSSISSLDCHRLTCSSNDLRAAVSHCAVLQAFISSTLKLIKHGGCCGPDYTAIDLTSQGYLQVDKTNDATTHTWNSKKSEGQWKEMLAE